METFKMEYFLNKVCLCLLICSFVSHREVYSQSNCPPIGSNFTNGIRAELITANDGVSLLGVRVLWTIKTEYLNCQFLNLRVEISDSNYQRVNSASDSSADFYSLNCNTQYTPRLTASVSGISRIETGDSLFYGGTLRTVPYPPPTVCVGRDLRYGSRVKLFWDLLPCHIQNGAVITSYNIQYNRNSSDEYQIVSSSDSRLTCSLESSGGYGCLFDFTLLSRGVSYTFQVAAVNSYGVGPFSDPVIRMFLIQNVTCIFSNVTTEDVRDVTTSSNQFITPDEVKKTPPGRVTSQNSTARPSQDDSDSTVSPSYLAWILVGILVVIVIVLVGVLITSVTFNYIFWKRLKSGKISKTQQSQLHESKIDMKECSAYGHVTSTTTTSAEDQHVYESAK